MTAVPDSARLKEGSESLYEKPNYRVTNCFRHNLSLKKRGQINLHWPAGELKYQLASVAP